MSAPLCPTAKLQADLHSLAARWLKEKDNPAAADGMGPQDVAERLTRRAERVRRAAGMATARRLETVREWQVRWRPEEICTAMVAKLKELGWRVSLSREDRMPGPAIAAMEARASEDVLVIQRSSAKTFARKANALGLAVPLRSEDGLAVLLAEEVFDAAAATLGRAPAHPWVDPVARHVFAQEVLGLPFSPWVVAMEKGG